MSSSFRTQFPARHIPRTAHGRTSLFADRKVGRRRPDGRRCTNHLVRPAPGANRHPRSGRTPSRLLAMRSFGTMPHAMTPTTPKLAYRDEAFLDSDAARPLRILAEYLQPLHAFERELV